MREREREISAEESKRMYGYAIARLEIHRKIYYEEDNKDRSYKDALERYLEKEI